MLLKFDLKRIADARLADANALFMAGRFDGAAYLCGYVIEVALKMRICRTMKWEGFPESRKEFEGLLSFKTHDLDLLLHLSGIENKVKQLHFQEWSTVKAWNPESRYNRVSTLTKREIAEKKSEIALTLRATELLLTIL